MLKHKKCTCCFTGHRRIDPSEYSKIALCLRQEIVKLIDKGIIYFGAGGALGFDTIAAQTILALKAQYPQIKLILVLPCKTQTRGWSKSDTDAYETIKSACDKVVYISDEYTRDCMHKRNRHLVDNSGYCLCYLTQNTGGTAYTVKYARENGLCPPTRQGGA